MQAGGLLQQFEGATTSVLGLLGRKPAAKLDRQRRLHLLGRGHAEQVERAAERSLRGTQRAEPEGLDRSGSAPITRQSR